MKFTVQKRDIVDILSKVQGLTGRKGTLAATSNVFMKTSGAAITITATDLETGFEGIYPAAVEIPGMVLLNSKKFYEIIRDFPEETVYVNKTDNGWIQIGNENVDYHLLGMNCEEFPLIPKIEDADYFSIDSGAFKNMIEKSLAIGVADEKRAHTNGVYLERILTDREKILRMVSTDGSRLSKADYIFDSAAQVPEGSGLIIPKKGLAEVNKFLDEKGAVEVGVKENHFIVKKESEIIIIRLLEGIFPKYAEIISKEGGKTIDLNRQRFIMMLKRMSILSSDDYKWVVFVIENENLTIYITNPEIGESKEEIKINYSGDPMKMAFNPRFFLDTLNVIGGEDVRMTVISQERPCYVEDKDDPNFLTAIMPMRI